MDDCSNQLPVLDSSTVFTFLKSEDRRTIYEVALPSLDELFQLKPTTDNETTTTSTTTSTPTPTTTMTQRGGAKLVLDGYTYMKKRDLKNSRDWICTKRDRRRNGNNGIIGYGGADRFKNLSMLRYWAVNALYSDNTI